MGRLCRDTRGAGLVEYLILVGCVGLLAYGAFRQFGTSTREKIEGQARCLEALDAGCAKGANGAEAPSRAEVVNAVATASAAATQQASTGSGDVKVAATGLGAKVLEVLSWFNPIGSAQAAETPRAPAPARPTRATANVDGHRIADAVVAELRRTAAHGEMGNDFSRMWPRSWIQSRDMWGESWGNKLPDALLQSPPASHWGRPSSALAQPQLCGDACSTKAEKEFGIKECKSQGDCSSGSCTSVAAAGASLCTGHSDFLYDEVYKTIAGAQRTVTFATLAEPSGSYTAAMRNALVELHQKQPPGGKGVDVRILVGRADDGDNAPGTNVRRILADLTRDLPPDSPVRVTVGTYGGEDVSKLHSWSHAKMIVADGKEALVGGHNWWVGDYNMQNPVHDVSLRVRGPAARHAEAYFDQLWAYTLTSGKIASSGTGRPLARAPIHNGTPGEGVRVIAVGVPGGTTTNVTSGVAGDTALLAMIRSARRTVKLSQQELVSQPIANQVRTGTEGWAERRGLPEWARRHLGERAAQAVAQHIDPKLLDELALAMMRGVKVDVVLTGMDPASGTEGYSHGWSTEQTRQTIENHLRTNLARLQRLQPQPLLNAGAVADAVANLEIREMRFSDEQMIPVDGKDQPLRNHAKVLIVDDAAAYVGSQNMYPGGMAGAPPMTQLGEFGYIFVGETVPETMLGDYWERMWPLGKKN